MAQADFEAIVVDLERRYAYRYPALARRTALIVLLGYSGFLAWVLSIFIAGVCALAGAALAPQPWGIVFVVVGALLLGVAVWQALLVLWLPRCEEPPFELTASDAPELFALLQRMRRELRTPPIRRVSLTIEMNASVGQRSRLGILGWSYQVMQLGLPLMEMLTPAEFEAVLAHECGHLSARHGRFGAWIYRTRETWQQLFIRLQNPPTSRLSRTCRSFLWRFVDWYWPRFHAYFFVTSRVHEYDADRCAVDWSGPVVAAASLWKIDLCGRRVEREFWARLWRGAGDEPEAPSDVSQRMLAFFASEARSPDAPRWCRQTAAAVTDRADTHPCVAERVAAMGGSIEACQAIGFPTAPEVSAAKALIGGRLDAVRARLDQDWQKSVANAWRQQAGRAASLKRRLEKVDGVAAPAAVSVTELWTRATSQFEVHGFDAAEPILREVVARKPTHAAANLLLGRGLLERGDADGEARLQAILDLHENELIPDACATLAQHFQANGRQASLHEIRATLGRYHAAQAAAQQERSVVSVKDAFLPADLEASDQLALHEILSRDADLAEAYVVRKQLKHFTHQPLFILCVRSKSGYFGRTSAAVDDAIVARLIPQVRLPGRILIVSPHGGFRALARKIMSFPEAKAFPAAHATDRETGAASTATASGQPEVGP